MSDTAAPAAESKTSNAEQSFLARLVAFGDELIPAERPAFEDVSKVLGGLIHWIDQGGGFEVPESFNPALSQAVAEQEAEQSRLAAENAQLSERLSGLETLMRQQIAAQGQVPAAPVSDPSSGGTVSGEGAAPVAPAPAPSGPTAVVPGVTEAPPEAEAPVSSPAPPVSE